MRLYFGAGINEIQTPDINEAADGSYNFELAKDSNKLIPRAPFDLKGTATNGSEVRGLMQLVKRDDTTTTLVQAGANVYKWNGSSTFSSSGTVTATAQLRDVYWSLGDYLVITDLQKAEPVSKWDGTTFSTLSTGLGSTLYAKYGTVHNGRVWLFNVKTSTDTPHLMVASVFENPISYDITNRATSATFSSGLEAFYMLTPDLRPINGVAKTLAGELIISTVEGALFKLSGTSSINYKWDNFYPGSNAVGNEAMVSSGNDVLYMRRGGNIDSLQATQNYGDVAADDLSRWIQTTVKDLTSAIAIYDQTNQKVLFFISGKVLVFYKDIFIGGATTPTGKARLSPWSIYKTQHASNFTTSVAKYMRIPGTTNMSVYFGGSTGQIYDLNGTGTGGDGGTTPIQLVRKTRYLDDKDGLNFLRHVTRGRVSYRRMQDVSFSINLEFGDEYTNNTAVVNLKGDTVPSTMAHYGGPVYYGGNFYYMQGFVFANKISHQNFSIVGRGSGVVVTLSAHTALNYRVDDIELL
jgi:hypothetical protein